MKLKTIVWIIACVIAGNAGSTRPVTAGHATILQLTEGIRTARLQLMYAEATISWKSHIPAELIPVLHSDPSQPAPHDNERNARWYVDGTQFAMVVTGGFGTRGPASQTIIVADKIANILEEYGSGDHWDGQVIAVDKVMPFGIWEEHSELDPRYLAYYWVSGRPLDIMLNDPNYTVKIQGVDLIYGSACVKVELRPSKTTREVLWFDTSHSYILRKALSYGTHSGREWLLGGINVPSLVESNGVWLPGKYVEQVLFYYYPGGARTPAQEQPFPPILYTSTITGFRNNVSVPPEVFEIHWPTRTIVQDDVHHIRFKVVADPMGLWPPGYSPSTDKNNSAQSDPTSTGQPTK